MIMPVMQFVSYLSYVGIAVVGGLRVASGGMSLGDATAFIQYSREFTQPLGQMAGMANMRPPPNTSRPRPTDTSSSGT